MPIRAISLIEWSLNELVTQFEMRGFKEGVKVGIKLADEIKRDFEALIRARNLRGA